MTPQSEDEKRGCVILGNWMLVGLGVACVAFHVGLIASMRDAQAGHGWDVLAVRMMTVPSALIGATLCVAVASRKVVPPGIRAVEALLVALITAGTIVEFAIAR